MYIVKLIIKNIIKHWKKSIFTMGISVIIVFFLSLYTTYIESNENQLLHLGESIPVTGKVCNIDDSREVGLQISFEDLKKMEDIGLTKNVVITMQNYADLTTITNQKKSKRPEISYIGTNSFSAFTAFSPKDVTYLEQYNESVLAGSEAVAILRNKMMEEQGLKLGDMLTISVYAPLYSVDGSENFQYKNLGRLELRIVGSYFNKYKGASDDLPSIISPVNFIASIYKMKGVECNATSASFSLKDPLRINEFKNKMQEIGFTSVDLQKKTSRVGKTLTMNDQTFIQTATQLKRNLNGLQALSPIIIVIIILVGFIASYILLQSRRYEYAIMRSLGTGKGRSFLILLLESVLLSSFGSIIGTCIVSFFMEITLPVILRILPKFLILYFSGTFMALHQLNKYSIWSILSKTD